MYAATGARVRQIEESLQAGMELLTGLDEHQVRHWTSWYRWTIGRTVTDRVAESGVRGALVVPSHSFSTSSGEFNDLPKSWGGSLTRSTSGRLDALPVDDPLFRLRGHGLAIAHRSARMWK